jgi:hypothetical protein
MSIARRLFTTTSRRCEALVNTETPAQLSPIDLPPTIYTLIARYIAQSPPSTTYSIPNPFLMHKPSAEASSSSAAPQNIPRAISRRREKQLLEHYSGIVLPPSKLNPIGEAPTIRWNDGEKEVTIQWAGEVGDETKKSLYGSRRRMFKGHKHERERPERERETKERMQGMEKRIKDWRVVRLLNWTWSIYMELTNAGTSRCQISCSSSFAILGPRYPSTRFGFSRVILDTNSWISHCTACIACCKSVHTRIKTPFVLI